MLSPLSGHEDQDCADSQLGHSDTTPGVPATISNSNSNDAAGASDDADVSEKKEDEEEPGCQCVMTWWQALRYCLIAIGFYSFYSFKELKAHQSDPVTGNLL